jgi:hypothetical protein
VEQSTTVEQRTQRSSAAAQILENLQRAETPEAFFHGLLHAQVERAEALHGVVWLPGGEEESSVRLLHEEPARVGEQAALAWRQPLARQAMQVFLSGSRHVERVSEPADRLLQGHAFWGASFPVPVGQAIAAVVTIVVTGNEQHVLGYTRAAAESVASMGLLYGTLQAGRSMQAQYEELGSAWDMVASVSSGYPDPEHMALAFVNKAKEFLGIQRASLGWVRRGKVKLGAVSDQDYVDKRSNLSRSLVAAMDEVVEAEGPILFPPPAGEEQDGEDASEYLPAHAALADLAENHAIASYPLAAGDDIVAVAVFERQKTQPFGPAERRVQTITCDQAAPAIGLARHNARGVLARCRDGAIRFVEALTGRGHVVTKIVALAICGLVALGIFGRWTLKVSGEAKLAPAIRRVYAAPFDRAILSETYVLPGQIVHKDDPLFAFDEEELRLSLRDAESKLIATRKQMDVHFSKQELADYKIASAQADELTAQIDLLNYRLSQAVVRAEFDGVVLTGDLRQLRGRPFQMGETLLEVAPLEELLLLLEVEQTDVSILRTDMHGTFATKAKPDVKIDFTVKKIRPMSEVREQSNVFIVEAEVRNTEGWLRPGMEAAANVYAGEHNIAWVFTRKLINWFRLKFFI